MSNYDKNETLTCLAEDCVYPASMEKTGINENEIIVGPTRSGKTVSVIEPKLLHTSDESLIVNVTKRALVDKYAPVFRQRGYQVWDLNLSDPSKSNVTYDPMAYIQSENDVLALATTMVEGETEVEKNSAKDPYWDQSAISSLAGIIGMAKMNAEGAGRNVRFKDFYTLYSNLRLNTAGTSLDYLFDAADRKFRKNPYSMMWRTLIDNSGKTSACIFSMMNNAVDKLMTSEALEMMEGDRILSFQELANKKTILFVTTSPVNKTMQKMTDMFFTDAFRCLFEYAESLPGKELPMKVHLICDDFATGCKIPDFHEYLSVFCAKKISVTLLLQSESQLNYMYGPDQAVTIINNCDTYVYFGGMDDTTCRNISQRRNIPIEDVYAMPLEQVMVFRRGSRPKTSRRYQTYQDPLYKELFADEGRSRES